MPHSPTELLDLHLDDQTVVWPPQNAAASEYTKYSTSSLYQEEKWLKKRPNDDIDNSCKDHHFFLPNRLLFKGLV